MGLAAQRLKIDDHPSRPRINLRQNLIADETQHVEKIGLPPFGGVSPHLVDVAFDRLPPEIAVDPKLDLLRERAPPIFGVFDQALAHRPEAQWPLLSHGWMIRRQAKGNR